MPRCMMLLTVLSVFTFVRPAAADRGIILPEDPSAPVAELWYIDPVVGSQPEVIVYRNGRVWARVGEGAIWGQLDEVEFTTVLNGIWREDRVSETSTDLIAQELESAAQDSGLPSEVEQKSETVIRLRTIDKLIQVRAPAVGVLATRYPSASALQKVAATQRRMENLRAVTMAGGHDAAQRLASQAKQQLLSEHGQTVDISCKNLTMVRSLPDGTRFCQFIVPSDEAPGRNSHVVSLFESPGTAPRISVLPNALRN